MESTNATATRQPQSPPARSFGAAGRRFPPKAPVLLGLGGVLVVSLLAAVILSAEDSPANAPPTARFTATCTDLSCSFDALASADTDGTPARFAWRFGDGREGASPTIVHAYADADAYTVTLTVTDNRGESSVATQTVTVTRPNMAAAPSFTSTCKNLDCSFSAWAPADAEGTASGFDWDLGDGTTGTGRTVTHAYPAPGTFTVALTVSDDAGTTGSVAHPVPVSSPSVPVFESGDTFERTETSGWGAARTGGIWTVRGPVENASVADGTGRLVVPAGRSAGARLLAVSTTDAEVTLKISADAASSGSGYYAQVVGRQVSSSGQYRGTVRFAPDNQVFGALHKVTASGETAIGSEVLVPDLDYAPGARYQVRVQVVGTAPTTLRLKVWADAQPEPEAWLISATDDTPEVQAAGSVGVASYVSRSALAPVTFTYDDFRARLASAPPTARFIPTCSGLVCSFDAGTSAGPEGSIASYSWTFGDGTAGTGATPTHSYASPGRYVAVLTVTAPGGSTGTYSRSLTVQ